MISSGGAFCAWMLAGKLKKLKQMRVRKLIADADFMFNRFGRSILEFVQIMHWHVHFNLLDFSRGFDL